MVPEASRESTITQEGTTAIDIPLSPRLLPYQRRSSSVAQQSRALIDDDDADVPFAANRSLSLGADDREPPTISGLLGRQLEQEAAAAAAADAEEPPLDGLQATDDIQPRVTSAAMPRGSSEDNPTDGFLSSIPSSSPFGRRRYTGMGAGRRQTPPHSSRGSFAGSANRPLRDDNESVSGEPLMFDLSEMDALGRRSLEEGRGYPHSSNN
jgi:autophagy-related protein 13